MRLCAEALTHELQTENSGSDERHLWKSLRSVFRGGPSHTRTEQVATETVWVIFFFSRMRYNAAGLSNLVASGLENWSCAPLDFGAWSLLRGASSFQMHVNEKDGMMRSSCKKSGETTACVASLDVCVPTKDNFFVAKCRRPRLSRFFFLGICPCPTKMVTDKGAFGPQYCFLTFVAF